MTQHSSTIDQEPPQPIAGGSNNGGGQKPPVTFSPQDEPQDDGNITPETFACISVQLARSLSTYRQARREEAL